MYADGRHCLQPKKTTEIYNKKSANQSSSYADKPAGFIFIQNKPSQTNIFFIDDTMFKTKLLQQFKLAWRKMLLMELDCFANGSCASATIVSGSNRQSLLISFNGFHWPLILATDCHQEFY
ncbi:MAG: hypothetical protein H7254_01955 [Ferruginibacter sp.]|nr:hypothetical protein [Ferruginibacter sp.]